MEQLKKEIELLREKTKQVLIENFKDAEFVEVDTHYILFKIGDTYIKIWTANGKDSASFYEGVYGFSGFDYTDEERDMLWDRVEKVKAENGEKRRIDRSQMRSDMFFSFQGVFGKVKFYGYDDSDWWTKYKPAEVKEDENITWIIDYENMVALYKPQDK